MWPVDVRRLSRSAPACSVACVSVRVSVPPKPRPRQSTTATRARTHIRERFERQVERIQLLVVRLLLLGALALGGFALGDDFGHDLCTRGKSVSAARRGHGRAVRRSRHLFLGFARQLSALGAPLRRCAVLRLLLAREEPAAKVVLARDEVVQLLVILRKEGDGSVAFRRRT
jgi:hypothetical protein